MSRTPSSRTPPEKRQRVSPSTKPCSFEPRNILVTGGCGFIASHVVIRLVKSYPQYKVQPPWPTPTRRRRVAE